MEITVHTVCNVHHLMSQIVSELTREDLVELIQYIDLELVSDIDFTKEMYEFFKSELEKGGEI